jgi:integrase
MCSELGVNYVKSVSTDIGVTREWAVDASRQIDRRRLGLVTPQEERVLANAAKALLTLLEEFTTQRRATKITEKEVGTVDSQCKRLFEMMEATALADLTEDSTRLAIAALVDEEDLSLETANKYLKAIKRFAKWLSRKAGFNDEIRFIAPYNAATGVVHSRRALTELEVEGLLMAAAAGVPYMNITGPERELVYLLAVTSGLRANELRTLRPEHFRIHAAGGPIVIIEAKNSKHKKLDQQPLREDVAERMAAFIKGKPLGKLIWDLPKKAFLMLQADYAAMEEPIEYENAYGFADFHSLRHTYGTRLGYVERNIKVVKLLMRHSDIRLTERYMHATLHDQRGAVERMPALAVTGAAQQADGTYGVQRTVQRAAVPQCPAKPRTFPALAGGNGQNHRENPKKNPPAVPAALLTLNNAGVGLRSRRL